MQASTDRIVDAYYELGYLYKDRVKNEKKAIETFEKLSTKYPKNKFQAETYYVLYLMNEDNKNFSQSAKYKSKILNEYPDSKFAAMLKDPNYQKKEDIKKNEVFTYYDKTFEYFQGKAYQEVIERIATAMQSFKPNPIEAKYALLKAVATGGLGDITNYSNELNAVIKTYPNTPEKKKAEELLAAIRDFGKEKPKIADNNNDKPDNTKNNTGKTSGANSSPTGATGGSFEYDPSIEHYFVVVFKSLNPKAAAGLGNVSNFINKNHSLDNLLVTTQMLGMNSQMAIVKSFPNADKASEFLDEIDEQASQLFKGLNNTEYYTMIITQHNFEEMSKLGYSNSYQTFYEEKYFGEQ
jgi:tetratricopeptide (TPR) repeat protein